MSLLQKKNTLDCFTRDRIVVGFIHVDPQVRQICPIGGRGGVDAGDPLAWPQLWKRPPDCRPVLFRLASKVEELLMNASVDEPPPEPALV